MNRLLFFASSNVIGKARCSILRASWLAISLLSIAGGAPIAHAQESGSDATSTSAIEESEETLPMTIITPIDPNVEPEVDVDSEADVDSQIKPQADITGNCGRVIFKKIGPRKWLSDRYKVTVISFLGAISSVTYSASTTGGFKIGAYRPSGAHHAQVDFSFRLRNPFKRTALLNGFAYLADGTICVFYPNPA